MQGYTMVPILNCPRLLDAATVIFGVAHAFFAQLYSHKSELGHAGNAQGSKGCSHVTGEKELLTILRGGCTCPPCIKDKAWMLCRSVGCSCRMVYGMEKSLGMSTGVLDRVTYA